MKLKAVALAACIALPAAAQVDPTHWATIVKVGGGVALVKTLMDVYDWIKGKLVPNPQALWYCAPSQCNFSPAGTAPTQADLDMALAFIATLGKTWHSGEVITLCNGWTCIDFKHNSAGFEAVASYPDPNAGYTNRPRSELGGGHEGGSNYSPSSSTVWHPAAVYNPGSRTGTVTMTFGSFSDSGNGGGGGGGSGRKAASNDTD